MIAQLQEERRSHIRAILSNGGYLQSKALLDSRRVEIERINEHFDDVLEEIMDPGKAEREQRQMEENPLFSAGMRGLDRLKWDFQGAQQVAAQLQAQGF